MGKQTGKTAGFEQARISRKTDIMRSIWEAHEPDGSGVVRGWRLQAAQRAKLDQKLDMLQAAEVDESGKANLPPNLLAGPGYDGYQWIYKLKVRGNVQLRPMVCLGPIDRTTEWTVLYRAVERDDELIPLDAPRRADSRRSEILLTPSRRTLLRGIR